MRYVLTVQIAVVVLALLLVVALARIYFAAVLPVLRNQRLARRGFSDEPAYRGGTGRVFGLTVKILPVILVFAILAAIVIPGLQDFRSQAEDRQRIADIKSIQLALAAYYFDKGSYPVSQGQALDVASFAATLEPLVTGGYLASIPTDPSGGSYAYESTANGGYYCLGAEMSGVPPPSTCDTDKLGDVLAGADYTHGYQVGP